MIEETEITRERAILVGADDGSEADFAGKGSTDTRERAILVGADDGSEADFALCMEELEGLAEACLMETVGVITQSVRQIHRSLYVGAGKVEEIKEAAAALEADVIVFYETLSPSQLKNLQNGIGRPVLDRTALILDIFERRARTSEAKLQVEAAKLQYLLPRLIGMHEALTRQTGTSGSLSSRGGGEKKLELDRRKIKKRLDLLEHELKEVASTRETMRKKRAAARIPLVSLVGYTNAGKSSLLNALIDTYMPDEEKKVLEQDMLFATLDTTVRRIETENNQDFLLADTVGFIHRLPPSLVKAFRSTLEEVKGADLLLHVVDYADDRHQAQMKDTLAVLNELGAAHIPMITVYNKADKCMNEYPFRMDDHHLYMSASERAGLNELVEMIGAQLYADYITADFLIPYHEGQIVSYLMENSEVQATEHRADGTRLTVRCGRADLEKYKEYLCV
jgi:GTP-binding protein HflX